MRILLWVAAVLVAIASVDARPSKKNEQNVELVDESDRTLIRVARADLDEDEEPKVTSHKNRHKKRSGEEVVSRKKRATEEDEFFQALLSRKEDSKKEKKRSYEEGAEDKAYIKRDDWKGDSKISDADRHELESLFSEITSPAEEKEKVQETRSLKPGIEGKIQNFLEWLMSQPPDKFTKSLSHILDTEASLSKTFYDGNAQSSAQVQDASSNSTNSTLGGNCTNKCYTFDIDGTKCEISCSPPVIEASPESPYAPNVQLTSSVQYPVQQQMPCAQPNCQGVGAQGYPQVNYPAQPQYGAQMPPMTPQWPVQSGCTTGSLCDTGNRKSDPSKDSDKNKNKDDDKKNSAAVAQGGTAQVPVANQGPVNAMQIGPVQVMADPSASFSNMVPVVPAVPLVPVSPIAPAPVPVIAPQAPVQPYMNGYQQGDGTQRFQPMPKNCDDYSSSDCQVFLDWPTDEHNKVKASLRFRQNWDDDYNDKESRRFKVLKTEIEKGITNAYIKNPNFEDVEVKSLSKEDMKVSANFVMRFKQAEYGVLRYLSRAISSNYLQSMPLYRDTLLRDGLKHHHRSIVAKQEELDKVPSRIQDPEPEVHESLTTASKAYQGCFRDRKPVRDMQEPFSKYDMTPEWCVGRCKLAGYKFAGLQYAYLCFCGNSFGKYGRALNDQCDSRCFGDSSRHCGSFWHNSVYSVDGKAYNPMKEQHANINGEYEGDEDKDEKDDQDKTESEEVDSSSDDSNASGSGEENDDPTPAAQVANKLMKAAASALTAAKKLLPHGEKSKRSNDEELERSKADAIAALGDAQNLMSSSSQVVRRQSERRKREAELQHGKDLLVAYLSDVGGYDRQYRDVEDQDENGSKDKETKFEYRRMIIDEAGDGEFIERKIDQKKIKRARLRRNIASQNQESFNGPLKMANRAVEENAGITKRSFVPEIQAPMPYVEAERKPSDDDDSADEATESGNSDEQEGSGEFFKNDDDNDDNDDNDDASGKSEPSDDTGESGFGLESGESGNAEDSGEEADDQDGEEYGFSRETRSARKSGATLSRGRRDLEEDKEKDVKESRKTRKRDVPLSDDKVSTITELAKHGVDGLVPIVVGIFKQERRMRAVDNFVAQLKQNILKEVSVSQEQEQVLMDRTENIIKAAVVEKLNELSTSIRAEMQDYKVNHPAVNQQAKEALDAILDLPVFQDAVDNLKNRIKKRAVDLEEEYKKVKEGSETLPPILKEHFKRNAPEDKMKESLSRRHRDVKH